MTPSTDSPRIGLVYGDYPPNPPGRSDGGSDFLRRLAEGLVAHGHDVTAIVSSRDDRQSAFTSDAGVHVAPVIRDWTLRGAIGGQLSSLRQVLRDRDIDVVHLIYPDPFLRYGSDSYHLPFLLKAASRRPLVVTFFGFGVTGAGLVAKAGLFSLFASSNRLVITDADLLRRFRRTLPWWGRKAQAGLVGSIVDEGSPTWSRDALKQRKAALGLNPAQRHVGFFGFWSPDKGLENLLMAHQKLRRAGHDIVLVLIGGRAEAMRFEYERSVMRLAAELGIAGSVVETGPKTPVEISEYMVAMDACALPFKVNPLGRSSLALALNLGVPTLVTRPHGADARLLTGLPLLGSLEPDAIAAAIIALVDDSSAQDAASEAARRAAHHWSWDEIVSQYAGLYGEVARHGRSR
ncbi:MAG: glycosyltransferase [Candidatus Dormibacterales bacterium]